MTSLRRALKASLTIEEKPPTVRPPHRGSRVRATSDDASRHQRRHGDDAAAVERQGPGAHSERNRAAGGSGHKGQGVASRRGRSSTGYAGDASSEDGGKAKSGSGSDRSVTNAIRGRLSLPERRQGAGSAVKREKSEPVPVSPPRQSVIAASHEAKEGSQIKVKFDTGEWFSGVISKVDNQRGIIVIYYDDGTKETSRIPDSDVVIYKWLPPELRVRPRPLLQYLQDVRGGGKTAGGGAHFNSSSRKHGVKTEPRATSSLRRKTTQARDRGAGRKREPLRGGRSSSGHGVREGSKTDLSPSLFEEDGGNFGEGDEADDEGERWAEGGTTAANNNEAVIPHRLRKDSRGQQKSGGGRGTARGRATLQRQAQQRKRTTVGAGGRNRSASKRQRVARSAHDGDSIVSESEFAVSEDEEELDDASLGIKTRACNPRASSRRKLPAKVTPQKRKGELHNASDVPSKPPGTETLTACQSPRSMAGSSCMSESLSSGSDSSASSSSSGGVSEIAVKSGHRKKVGPETNQVNTQTKCTAVPAIRKAGGEQEEDDDRVPKAKEGSPVRGKAVQQRNEEQQKNSAEPRDKPEETRTEKHISVPSSKSANSSSAVAAVTDKPNAEQTNVPRGWQESSSRVVLRGRQDGAQANLLMATANGREAGATKSRSRVVRGQGSRGGSKIKQVSARPGRLEAYNRSSGGAQQQRSEDASVGEASTSLPQKCAEKKEGRSAHSSSLRKSPRSKETPSPTRRNEGTQDALRHRAPSVAEAKGILSSPEPSSAPLATKRSTSDSVYGWEVRPRKLSGNPKQRTRQPVPTVPKNNPAKVMAGVERREADHKDGLATRAACEVPSFVDSQPVEDQPSTVALMAGENALKESQPQRSKDDDRNGRIPQSRTQPAVAIADVKDTRAKETSSEKSKEEPNISVKSRDAALVPVANSTSGTKAEKAPPAPAGPSPEHSPAADAFDFASKTPHQGDQVMASVAREAEPPASAPNADATVLADSTRDAAASEEPDVADAHMKEAADPCVASLVPMVAPAMPSPRYYSKAVSPRHYPEAEAMEVDSIGEDEASLSENAAAVKRRLYSSGSGEDEMSRAAKLSDIPAPPKKDEIPLKVGDYGEALPVDDGFQMLNAQKPKVAESVSDKTGLKRTIKPARKRPRSEEKPGPGAKSDWPAPVVSRATRPDSNNEAIDKVDTQNSGMLPVVTPVPLESESSEGASAPALLGSSAVQDKEKAHEVRDVKVPTTLNEKATPDDGVDSPVGLMESRAPASAAKDKNSSEDAGVSLKTKAESVDGERKRRDLESGEMKRVGSDRHGVGALMEGRDGGNSTEPSIPGRTEGPDGMVQDEIIDVPKEFVEGGEPSRPSAAGSDSALIAEASKTADASLAKLAEKDSSDTDPSFSPKAYPHLGVEVVKLAEKDSGDTDPSLLPKAYPHLGVEVVDADQEGNDNILTAKDLEQGDDQEIPSDTVKENMLGEKPAVVKAEAKQKLPQDVKEADKDDRGDGKDDRGDDKGEKEGDKDEKKEEKDEKKEKKDEKKEDKDEKEKDKKDEKKEEDDKDEKKEEDDKDEKEEEDDKDEKQQDRPSVVLNKHTRSDSGETHSGSDCSGAASGESRPAGRRRFGVTRFEPSMETDRNRLGQHRPERHERQAAVLATKRLAASAPLRRASRGGRGHDSGGRGRRGSRGRRGLRAVVREPQEESEGEDDDDDDDGEEGVDWVQCDNCEKWWTLPSSVNAAELPDVWHCRMQDWGKPVVDCLVPKEPQGKSGTGAAHAERKLTGKEGVRASSTASVATSGMAAGVEAYLATAPDPPANVAVPAPAEVEANTSEQATAAAEAEAALALVAAAATAAAATIETPRTALPLVTTAVPIGKANEETSNPAKESSRPVPSTNPAQEAEARPTAKIADLAHVPAKLPPEHPPSAPPTDDLDKTVEKVVEKPSAVVRGKRKREGAANVSSSDDEGGRGARYAEAGACAQVEESRPRTNSIAGRWGGTRGRVRRHSSGSLGRDAVAALVKAAESRRDREPTLEGAEVRAGRVEVSWSARPSGIRGRGGVSEAGALSEQISQDQWVMCDHENCGKWRRVPPGVNLNGVDKWYCEMATWSPATANCEHPEDSTEMVAPSATTSGGGRGGASGGASYRGRRIGSRSSRTASEGSEGGIDEDKAWRKDGEGALVDRRWSDAGSGGGGLSRGRVRTKKNDLLWVQCDKCEKWRKLANDMRNEDLPEKWYCQMNTWSLANDCSFPDEYDVETSKASGDTMTSWVVDSGESGGGGGRVSASGLLARGASCANKKANGRLSYRNILFNNDGKLRPPYSAGPCASSSAGYLFPKPGDSVDSRVKSESHEDLSPSRSNSGTGFHFSNKYCSVTGPKKPPSSRQHLLTASLKLTSLLTRASLTRPSSGDVPGASPSLSNGNGSQRLASSSVRKAVDAGGEAVRHNGGWGTEDAEREAANCLGFANSKGTTEPPSSSSWPGALCIKPTPRRTPEDSFRRIGTYERLREERSMVMHYLLEATAPRPGQGTPYLLNPKGVTATGLLAAMKKCPWKGRMDPGTLQQWKVCLDHLEPTLERHLRWLTADGLAALIGSDRAPSEGGGMGEARFVAIVPADGEADSGVQHDKRGFVAGFTGVSAGGNGILNPGASSGFGLSMITRGRRIMKSRPIKMAKPWR